MNARTLKTKANKRVQRKRRIRVKISGSEVLPRVSVFRSNRYFSAQAISDDTATTLAAVHSKASGLKANREDVVKLAEQFAANLKAANITAVVFDRNGYQYHGVVAAFGDALRANEIKF
jgi:large subunit ribosomal protein L18